LETNVVVMFAVGKLIDYSYINNKDFRL
jgi:hypothetical protein